MAAQDFMLCIDIGASSIKAAEFSYSPAGDMLMERFAYKEFAAAENTNNLLEISMEKTTSENTVKLELLEALQTLITENKFKSQKIYLSLSGQDAYIRFVKVPSMVKDEKKIKQIIEYEVRNAIPFDLSEVVWDSQLLNYQDESGEIEAMFVIVKGDEIEQITSLLESMGKKVTLVEVSPTACYNAARLNGIGDENCEIILNIGDRSSTLLFIDGGRLFVRIIPIAGRAITAQISKEFGISTKEAEEMKRRHGFVALGGAYEEPDSEVAAIVSKIVRNVMTRLHGEISRSINIYRSQQKGRKPEKLYLSGGSSVMAYTPRFFQEKLKIPVEYLNPFKNIAISDAIDKENLADIAHMFSETIGLALRHNNTCPIEISLTPQSMQRFLEFKTKIPFFYASAVTLLLCLLITFAGFTKQEILAQEKQKVANTLLKTTRDKISRLNRVNSEFSSAQSEYQTAADILKRQEKWPDLLNQVQSVLPDNIWLTKVELSTSDGAVAKSSTVKNPQNDPGNDMFGNAFGGGGQQQKQQNQQNQNYVSVYMEGHGLVSSNDFSEKFTEKLSKSQFFVFNKATNVIDTIQDGIFGESGVFNVATFTLTLKMKNAINR